MAKIIAVVRDRSNGDVVAGEDVNFRNPALTILDTDTTSADGSATYVANGNAAGLITWDASVSGETRKAGARAQRQIGPLFEAELAKSFKGIMSDGYSEGDGSECAVIPGSGRQLVVGTGCVWVQGIPFHFYTTTALATTANATLATRLDSVVLRVELDDSATTYGKGTLVVREGTVNNTPVTLASATAGTYEYELARVTSALGFSSYTAGNISDQREQAGPYAVPIAALPSAIPATLIGDGSVTNAEFGYIGALTSDAQTQLNAKADESGGLFTGLTKVTATSDPAFVVETSGGTDLLYVTTTYNGVHVANGGEFSTINGAPGVGTKTFIIDGATGNVTVGGVTLTPTELSYLDGASSNLQTQITAKAATASPTFTGTVTAAALTATGTVTLGDADSDLVNTRGRIKSSGTSPSSTLDSNAGSGASRTIAGTDMAGTITLITGTGAAAGSQLTITFASAKSDAEYTVIINPANASATASAAKFYAATKTSASWQLIAWSGGSAPSSSTTHVFEYMVIEREA